MRNEASAAFFPGGRLSHWQLASRSIRDQLPLLNFRDKCGRVVQIKIHTVRFANFAMDWRVAGKRFFAEPERLDDG